MESEVEYGVCRQGAVLSGRKPAVAGRRIVKAEVMERGCLMHTVCGSFPSC